MNHLIIIAHPRKGSLNYSIINRIKELAEASEIKVKIRDLYQIKFKPVLEFGELKYLKEGNICPDILVEQSYISWANEVTIIYPLWWNAFPAILKGYIDRVFTNGFAFKITKNGVEGLLKDKKVRLITSAGMDEKSLKESNIFESLRVTQDFGVFEFCGMQVIDHIYITESTGLSESQKTGVLDDVGKRVMESSSNQVALTGNSNSQ